MFNIQCLLIFAYHKDFLQPLWRLFPCSLELLNISYQTVSSCVDYIYKKKISLCFYCVKIPKSKFWIESSKSVQNHNTKEQKTQDTENEISNQCFNIICFQREINVHHLLFKEKCSNITKFSDKHLSLWWYWWLSTACMRDLILLDSSAH